MELSYWSKGNIERIYFNGAEGYFERRLARAYSGEANSFACTVPAEIFEKVVAFTLGTLNRDDENIFFSLRGHASNFQPEGLSARSTKEKRVEQKARVAAFIKAFG